MRIVPAAIFVLLVALASTKPATGCTCAPSPPLDEELRRTPVVFVGTVVSRSSAQYGSAFAFRVSEVWKGVNESRVVVHTARDEAACGVDFSVGHDYLVFAYTTPYGLETTLCSRTQPVSGAGQALGELGQSALRFAEVEVAAWPWLLLAGLMGAVLGSVATAWLLRRR